MQFPLVGFCDGDLYTFSSAEQASAEIEPADVRASSWKIYDSDGQRIGLNVVSRPISKAWPLSWFSVEHIELLESKEFDQTSLAKELNSFFDSVACERPSVSSDIVNRASLTELIGIAVRLCKPIAAADDGMTGQIPDRQIPDRQQSGSSIHESAS
jgi:hypothetical protein